MVMHKNPSSFKRIRVRFYFVLICVTVFQLEASAMSFGKQVCVFSAVEGTVLQDGKPVRDALVKRSYKWDGEDVIDQQTTDEDGRFSFPEANEKSLMAIFPHNPAVTQFIKFVVDDTEYLAWGYVKGNYDVNGELEGRAMNLKCDLNSPEATHKLTSFKSYGGICELL